MVLGVALDFNKDIAVDPVCSARIFTFSNVQHIETLRNGRKCKLALHVCSYFDRWTVGKYLSQGECRPEEWRLVVSRIQRTEHGLGYEARR